jgi:nitroreductase
VELTEALLTTFSARQFTDDPVPDAVIHRILDQARFAPSGGNRQGWRVIVLRDPAVRRALVDLTVPAVRHYAAQAAAGESPWNTVHPTRLSPDAIAATPAPARLLEPAVAAPVALLVCVDLGLVASLDRDLDRVGVTSGASIYPFVWSLLLAARQEGLGGVLTTFITAAEPEVRRLLHVPPRFAVAALVPLGLPVRRLTRLTRRPVEAFATRDRWDGPPLDPGGP